MHEHSNASNRFLRLTMMVREGWKLYEPCDIAAAAPRALLFPLVYSLVTYASGSAIKTLITHARRRSSCLGVRA